MGELLKLPCQKLEVIAFFRYGNETESRQIYSTLTNDPIRAAIEHAQADMLIAAKLMQAKDNEKTMKKNRQEVNRLADLDRVFHFQTN